MREDDKLQHRRSSPNAVLINPFEELSSGEIQSWRASFAGNVFSGTQLGLRDLYRRGVEMGDLSQWGS